MLNEDQLNDPKVQKLLGNPYGTTSASVLKDKLRDMKKDALIKMAKEVNAYHADNSTENELRESITSRFKKDPKSSSWSSAPKAHVYHLDPEDPKVIALKRAGIL